MCYANSKVVKSSISRSCCCCCCPSSVFASGERNGFVFANSYYVVYIYTIQLRHRTARYPTVYEWLEVFFRLSLALLFLPSKLRWFILLAKFMPVRARRRMSSLGCSTAFDGNLGVRIFRRRRQRGRAIFANDMCMYLQTDTRMYEHAAARAV